MSSGGRSGAECSDRARAACDDPRVTTAPSGGAAAVVFKIATRAEWDATRRTGAFPGSAADVRDGFIHLSDASQVRATAERHFAGMRDLVLLDVDMAVLASVAPGALRWEPSRGGALFPHVYGPLPLAAIVRARALPLGADGVHVFPEIT